MQPIHCEMIREARKKSGEIRPCGTKKRFDDCFTHVLEPKKRIVFWYDTPDHSTHIIVRIITN